MNKVLSLSPREKRMALLTALVLALVVAFTVGMRAMKRIRELDESIAVTQERLLAGLELQSRLEEVDKVYAEVAARHATRMSTAEILDSLRNEIIRLSLVNEVPEGAESASYTGARLVEFPTWPEGELDDRGGGYMEYRLRLRTKPTSIGNVARFLQRLEASSQLLRVDSLEVSRPNPEVTSVTASFTVTRPVIVAAGESVEESAENVGTVGEQTPSDAASAPESHEEAVP